MGDKGDYYSDDFLETEEAVDIKLEPDRCSNCCRIGSLHIQCTQKEGHYGYCHCIVKCEYGEQDVSVMWGNPIDYKLEDYVIPF